MATMKVVQLTGLTDGGFVHGGWTWPYWHDDIGKHFFEAMSQADALLQGRKQVASTISVKGSYSR